MIGHDAWSLPGKSFTFLEPLLVYDLALSTPLQTAYMGLWCGMGSSSKLSRSRHMTVTLQLAKVQNMLAKCNNLRLLFPQKAVVKQRLNINSSAHVGPVGLFS